MAQKAPGKNYRNGKSLIELFQMFPDDTAAEKWFEEVRWPDGIHCPHCGHGNIQVNAEHSSQSYRCRKSNKGGCGKRFSVKTETVMQKSNLGLQTWAVATYLLTTNLKSVSSMKLHRDLKITQKTAWLLARKIRSALEDGNQSFHGIVEVDETYVDGLEKNKHRDKKLKTGSGAVGKSIVAGAKDREANQVSAKVVENTKRKTLHDFIRDNVEQGSTVCTDDFKSYEKMQGFDHQSVKHSVGEYVDENIHINGMESFWSVLKRAYKGTFHKISHKHLNRYVTEFAGKHNNRPLDTIRQMESIVQDMVGKQLTYKDIVTCRK